MTGTVRSKDGTTIAFDAWGDGRPLIMIDGATGHRQTNPLNAEVAVFEPPFVVDDGRPPLPADYVERLDAYVAEGRPGDALEYFMTVEAGGSAEQVAAFRQSPYWATFEAVAHTIAYDGRIMDTTMSGAPPPRDRWSAINVPTLVMHGNDTMPWLISGAQALAGLLPTATLKPVPGENHATTADVLAPVLRQFADGQ
jgi:pimeloyl-ACP methyl ester carboxylesterase